MAAAICIATTMSLYYAVYLSSPVLANVLFTILVTSTAITAIHAWYTRRTFTESLTVLTSPFTSAGAVIWELGETIRRNEPPTQPARENTTDTVSTETIKQQYVNGEIKTEQQLEAELERTETLPDNTDPVDEFETEQNTTTID